MRYYVYILGSEGGVSKTYVGWTIDLNARLKRHNTGQGAKSTRGASWVLLYAERHETKHDAMSRESYLKRDKRFRAALRHNGFAVSAPSPVL